MSGARLGATRALSLGMGTDRRARSSIMGDIGGPIEVLLWRVPLGELVGEVSEVLVSRLRLREAETDSIATARPVERVHSPLVGAVDPDDQPLAANASP